MEEKEPFDLFEFVIERKIFIGYVLAVIFLIFSAPSKASVFIGIVFCLIGEAIRTMAVGEAIEKDKLTTTGVFAYVRNPLYLGTFLVGLGVFIMGNIFIFIIAYIVVFFIVYAERIKEEEAELQERFNEEYDEYSLHVPSMLPRFTPWKREKAGFDFSLIKKHKEYQVWLIIYVITILMFLKT